MGWWCKAAAASGVAVLKERSIRGRGVGRCKGAGAEGVANSLKRENRWRLLDAEEEQTASGSSPLGASVDEIGLTARAAPCIGNAASAAQYRLSQYDLD